ncbi:hypothetical protein ABID22_000891 [Pontibacter aydingkolensis]|uniref:Uncharacterized protein n=1 Tax=Pontibacter aydingkolensis TaxID=1911536 RepID=A0ABS7CTP0_9BACT|nr:hypothetical protein [Pontibacter aydingkolensis]MBW7466857.1 hypothetical protein [Pontibacter aydingkolensis]
MAGRKGVLTIYESNRVPENKESMASFIKTFAEGTWKNFIDTNKSTVPSKATDAVGILVGAKTTAYYGAISPVQALNPLQLFKGKTPFPAEFTASGAIRVFEYTNLQRAILLAKASLAKVVLVTVAYEGGVLVGSIINQALPESTKDAIGGTIYEIVENEGWKMLFTNPFGLKK